MKTDFEEEIFDQEAYPHKPELEDQMGSPKQQKCIFIALSLIVVLLATICACLLVVVIQISNSVNGLDQALDKLSGEGGLTEELSNGFKTAMSDSVSASTFAASLQQLTTSLSRGSLGEFIVSMVGITMSQQSTVEDIVEMMKVLDLPTVLGTVLDTNKAVMDAAKDIDERYFPYEDYKLISDQFLDPLFSRFATLESLKTENVELKNPGAKMLKQLQEWFISTANKQGIKELAVACTHYINQMEEQEFTAPWNQVNGRTICLGFKNGTQPTCSLGEFVEDPIFQAIKQYCKAFSKF